jgi:hypothetical protein
MEVDPERTTSQDIIQIGSMDVHIGEDGKRPIVSNNNVVTSTPGVFTAANDHEASGSGSNSKYFLPRWCPPCLTRTQRRKLQRLRFQKKKELKKQRDEVFNQYRPMVPQGKKWRVKTSSQLAPVRSVEGSVTPVRPVEGAGHTDDPNTPLGFSSSVPMVCDDKSTSDPAPEDNEEHVDYSSSPERMNLDINVIHMSIDGYLLSEEDVVHLDFGPTEAIFQKPRATEKYLKALYMKGHNRIYQSHLHFILSTPFPTSMVLVSRSPRLEMAS